MKISFSGSLDLGYRIWVSGSNGSGPDLNTRVRNLAFRLSRVKAGDICEAAESSRRLIIFFQIEWKPEIKEKVREGDRTIQRNKLDKLSYIII